MKYFPDRVISGSATGGTDAVAHRSSHTIIDADQLSPLNVSEFASYQNLHTEPALEVHTRFFDYSKLGLMKQNTLLLETNTSSTNRA
jgi:hypothetical protein